MLKAYSEIEQIKQLVLKYYKKTKKMPVCSIQFLLNPPDCKGVDEFKIILFLRDNVNYCDKEFYETNSYMNLNKVIQELENEVSDSPEEIIIKGKKYRLVEE